ncbi:hypothetical protein K501DRAFT_226281 [Backusella circina FSU 941]|nr:hypothetical protein K501DRAFT_226281 [Backusella circina FSU 941]
MMNIESEKFPSRDFRYSKYNLQNLEKEIVPIDSIINRMREEIMGFQNCLDDTEKTVRSVQIDIDDTQNRMGTYIKDIPQDFYSELKRLEVEIDIILSKRAKNPWIDIGYALLSYLLAIIAIIVWVLIYILKKGKKVLLFPLKLWYTYRDYLSERNKLVRVASQISISGRRNSASIDRRASQPVIFTSAADMYESSVSQRIQ